MSCHTCVDEWTTIIHTHLPTLSKPQATVLALWSLGMVLARSCALSAVSVLLAEMLQRKANTVRQQLREWCDEAPAKQGARRQALPVEPCFFPLLRWVLSHWQGTQLALALDATTVGTRFTGLAISVVSRGCAIPVAWTILLANPPEPWRRHWRRLLRHWRPAIPSGFTVIVLADRGLYAPWLFRRIVRLGWHPFLRINRGGTFRPDPQATYRPLSSFVPQPGVCWRGTGTAFKSPQRRLQCPWLACWEEGDTDPWLILTDLPPEASEAGWYVLRAWIEVCQTQPIKMTWCPLRCFRQPRSNLRGGVKREHVLDVNRCSCHDDFADQALGDSLTFFKRELFKVMAQQSVKGLGMVNDLLPMNALLPSLR